MSLAPTQIRIDARDIATLLTAAGQWAAKQSEARVTSVNLGALYLCLDDCEPAEDQPGVQFDLTIDVSGCRLS